MKPWKIITLILLAAVGIIAGLVMHSLRSGPEPVYHGKTVDAWLDVVEAHQGPEYLDAINQIGPAAVPFVFRKLQANDSPWANRYRTWWFKLPASLGKLLPRPKGAFDVNSAAIALIRCGTDTGPQIVAKLRDKNPAVREVAWIAVPFPPRGSISTNEAITLSLPALEDNDPEVCLSVIRHLGLLGPAASNAVPGLIPLLSGNELGRSGIHANTAKTLGRIGPAASNAVPALSNMLVTGDSYVRICAADALWRITSNEIPSLDVIIKEFPSLRNNQYDAVDILRRMGPHAKPAFPLLANELNRPNPSFLLLAITNALREIDPEPARELFKETNAPQK